MTAASVKSDCDPVYQNSQLNRNQQYSYSKVKTFTTVDNIKNNFLIDKKDIPPPDLKDTDAATPCGLIAKSLFNDTFEIWYYKTEADLTNNIG